MCLYVPVKEMNVIDVYEINHIIRTEEMKSNECECLEQAILLQGLVLLELKGLRIISELDLGLAGQILLFAILKIMMLPFKCNPLWNFCILP